MNGAASMLSWASTFEPVPLHYHAGRPIAWVFTGIIAVLAGSALWWCLRRLARERDPVPVLMWVGSFVAVVNEPMLDDLCHIWYAPNLPLTLVTGWGMKVPLLVALAWAFFVGMTGYVSYLLLERGLRRQQIYLLWAFLMALDVALEYPALGFDLWTYYSAQPFKLLGFPLWMTWINATGMFLGGFLLWLLAAHLKGNWRWLVMLFPGAGYLLSWTTLASLNYLALEWNPPAVVKWGMSALTFGFCLLAVRGIAAVVATDSTFELSLTVRRTRAPAPADSPAPRSALAETVHSQ
jgi:hypothetical protein